MVRKSTADKRELILAAAELLYWRYGIRRTSLDDVAREAGIAKGTVYLYFDSKESLNAAVIEKACADITADARNALNEPGTLVHRIVAFLDAWKGKPSRLMASSPHTAEIIESGATVAASITAAFYSEMRMMLSETLREGGIVNDDAVSMLYAAAVGTLETGEMSEEAYRARLAPMVRTLIAGMGSS